MCFILIRSGVERWLEQSEDVCAEMLRLRLVTSRGPPYPSRSPRAHPSGWTRTQLC